ncbi:hypothetical protein HZC34_07475 [Candidatus Saganbacteria bacterium]|nr:hypothetical protein [Candidatus Saganbacteria bacterium]
MKSNVQCPMTNDQHCIASRYKKYNKFIVGIWSLGFGICLLVVSGCSTQLNVSDYYNLSASSTSSSALVQYSITSVDTTKTTGYIVKQTLPTLSFALSTRAKENISSIILPQVTFTSMAVTYSVVNDTQSVAGSWKPDAQTSGVSIVIPAASGTGASGEVSGSVSATIGNIASSALATQVFNKIGSVSASAAAPYAFTISLSTGLAIKANVTLSGTDDRGKTVTLPLSTTIYFNVTT